MRIHRHLLISTLSLSVFLAACDQGATDQPPAASAVPAPALSVYQQAEQNAGRSEADRQRDANRKPAEVMQFVGIKPGMRVLDLFSGGGYYTELLSYVAGPDGRVVAHTNAAYANFVGEEATNRYAGDRLSNVDILVAENNELKLPPAEFDAVMMVLTYHDIYYIDPDNGWPRIDGPALMAELYAGMKPGAVLGVVDHAAAAGAPRETGHTLHRIDPALARAEIEQAGFVFEAEGGMLRNPEDDHTLNMADDSIRGKTDRFVMRFRKPG